MKLLDCESVSSCRIEMHTSPFGYTAHRDTHFYESCRQVKVIFSIRRLPSDDDRSRHISADGRCLCEGTRRYQCRIEMHTSPIGYTVGGREVGRLGFWVWSVGFGVKHTHKHKHREKLY